MESSDFSRADTSTGAGEGMNGNEGIGAQTESSGGLKERAGNALSSAKERLADVGSTVRERTSSAKDSLADALESGADRLRQRTGGDGTMSAAGANGGSAAIADDRMAQVTTKVAGGMEATADWLREADLDGLKASVERQVKEHPGRTLLIAVGLGYLLGKALRGKE